MNIILVTVHYQPIRTSAAVQMRDLALQLVTEEHRVLVVTPDSTLDRPWSAERLEGMDILRVRAADLMQHGYARRMIAEARLSGILWRAFRASPFADGKWDLVAWYSPTIFFGPLVNRLKRRYRLRAYLVLRDIFPEWAVDLGLLRRGPVYAFLKMVAGIQYRAADVIGVQTPSNLDYMKPYATPSRRVEVLNNWLLPPPTGGQGTSISVPDLGFAGRTVFVYTGNMGIAQDAGIFLDAARRLRERSDIGFLFVGRGSDRDELARRITDEELDNVRLRDEIPAAEVPGLLAQCHVGMVALHPAHQSHNIPGKFVAYLHSGLPVLARVNPGTDLVDLIVNERVGLAYSGDDAAVLADMIVQLADDVAARSAMAARSAGVAERLFSAAAAARQVTAP